MYRNLNEAHKQYVAQLAEAICYKAGRSRVWFPNEVTGIFNWPNPSNRTVDLGSRRPLIEMSTRNLPGGKGRRTRKAENLTAICEPTV
jgi:hypothetical protein